ncbi:hypothetical protein BDV29DRAFT_62763 [Aspergillus leporis]|jgi:hypothetical protein|uniref:Uncharacterized protein n=1 Tax=Aspergillus leporis TaxID=41062 RepID=A0A5N5WP55_9EURO|nr:hypothetical protein BDV29DRAFT_62763 [Aspergillus leporis]
MMHVFGEKRVQDVEVIAIQESMINRSTTQMTTHVQTLQDKFHVAIRPTPSHAEVDEPRACFFINKRLHPKQWSIQHHSRFLSTLTLPGTGLREAVYIHNIYNPGPLAPSVLGELAVVAVVVFIHVPVSPNGRVTGRSVRRPGQPPG